MAKVAMGNAAARAEYAELRAAMSDWLNRQALAACEAGNPDAVHFFVSVDRKAWATDRMVSHWLGGE